MSSHSFNKILFFFFFFFNKILIPTVLGPMEEEKVGQPVGQKKGRDKRSRTLGTLPAHPLIQPHGR